MAIDEVEIVTGASLKYWSEVTGAGLQFLVLVGNVTGADLKYWDCCLWSQVLVFRLDYTYHALQDSCGNVKS